MEPEKDNYLEISYEQKRGLKLGWNFKDLYLKDKYFRHVFVICQDNEEQIVSMLQNFYKKMKNGDLFTCVFTTNNLSTKVGPWVEKSQLLTFTPRRYLRTRSKQHLCQGIKLKLIQEAGNESNSYNEPVVVNFLIGEKDDAKNYQTLILQKRHSRFQSFPYIVNIIGKQLSNTVSVHQGINFFGDFGSKFDNFADYYNKLVNSAVVQKAKVTIEAIGGELCLYNEKSWRQMDFKRIEAVYYGPSSQYEYDMIYLYQQEQVPQIQQEFQIHLELTLFSRKILRSAKRMKITFNTAKEYSPTVKIPPKYHDYCPQKGIRLQENPYFSQIIIKLKTVRKESEQI